MKDDLGQGGKIDDEETRGFRPSDVLLHRRLRPQCGSGAGAVRRGFPLARGARGINQSFAGDGFRDPVLVERGIQELPFINEVREQHARTVALIPWKIEAPVGPERLRQLACSGRVAEPAASQTEH